MFIGLHGGIGEDGTLQKALEDKKIPFNGSGSSASKLGMNKYKTAEVIKPLRKNGVLSAKKRLEKLNLFTKFKPVDYKRY